MDHNASSITSEGPLPGCDAAARAADEAGLVYVTDQEPGIRRRRHGRGFTYRYDDDTTVKSRAVLNRIRALAIPPAWTDVWICREPRGHLQATGRDDRHRKQYRYHDDWRTVRDANKFDRLLEFGTALGPLRRTIAAQLDHDEPGQDTVLATIVFLLDETLIRVGNAEYANDNETYGLTTLQDSHVAVGRRRVAFDFVGKHGQHHQVQIDDPRLARIVRRCHELGGKKLFTYAGEDGQPIPVSSADVNSYLRDLTGTPAVSAKDFRTWGGTVSVTGILANLAPAPTPRGIEHNVLVAIDEAAERLHNTRAGCRSSYVHPAVVDAYRDERLEGIWKAARRSRWYSRAEHAALAVLDATAGSVP